MTLLEAQFLHVRLTSLLVQFAIAQGCNLTWGQTLRTKEEAEHNAQIGAGIPNSLHLIKLAVDFSLFKGTAYLTTVEDYRPMGEYWKSLHPLARWGGDFHKPDADHFSIEWNGVK